MAVSSWLYRRRPLRRGFTTNKVSEKKEEKDVSVFDPNKDDRENTLRILTNMCRREGLSDSQKLSYLKILHKIIDKTRKRNAVFFMNNEHIFRCLKTCLASRNSGVRSAGYRVIRNCVNTAEDVVVLNELQIPKFIARSIDLGVTYEGERIQAFRLVVKILILNPEGFYVGVTRALISLVDGIGEVRDKMAGSSVVLLCYLCALNPELFIQCYGHSVLLRCSLEISNPRINECVLICLMFLMNKQDIREKANIHLDYVISAYTEWEKKRAEKEVKPPFKMTELSVLTVLRSWAGVYHFWQPSTSGIKVIVDVLYLHREDLRKAILELLYQIFGLDRKLWTDKLSVALANIDPSKYHESWNVNQRFVVAEGRDILSNKNFYRPNLSEVHTSLVLYAFLECGLLSALVEIVISPHSFLSIQALILLGVIVHLTYKLLPEGIIDLGPSLPSLAKYITNGLPYQRSQALTAVSAIYKIHEVLKTKPAPKSLFLKQLIFYSNTCKRNKNQIEIGDTDEADYSKIETQNEESRLEDESNEVQDKLNFYFLQLEFERRNRRQEMKMIDQHINKSNVLWFSDYREWRWDVIETSLKSKDESFVRLQEPYYKNYIKKLVHFFKPSSRIYSEIEYSPEKKELDTITTTAFYLIDFLLKSTEGGKGILLDDLLLDLSKELREVVVNESLYTIFFNPRHMINTMSQHYFLIIGRLSGTFKGIKALNKRSLLKICTEIVCSCRHEYYVKLIVSSLNYNVPGRNRFILSKAVCSHVESVRIYATELLLVLARLDVKNFNKWGLDLLISLMYNEDQTIATTSINILEELCYDKVYLESLLDAKPSLLHLLDKGNLLLVRFLSTQTGFQFLDKANYVQSELLKWEKDYNYRYAQLIEDELNGALTLHDLRDYEKNFKRLTYNGYRHEDVFIPFHLYGELSKHEKGFECLVQNGCIFKMAENIHKRPCDSPTEILELKSSLWGLSNMSTSKLGFEFLEKENIIEEMIKIAYGCPVLSVRATTFYCLSLVATTVAGAETLEKYGWHSVRRNRSEEWPPMNICLSLLDELWGSGSEENESTSLADASALDAEETGSVKDREPHEINSNPSPENTLSPPENLLEETKSSDKEIVDDSQSLEKEAEKGATSGGDIPEEEPQGMGDSDAHLKKKDSSSNSSLDGSSEGTKELLVSNSVNFHKLSSLNNSQQKLDAESDAKVQLVEDFIPEARTANTQPSSSSQLDLVSEPIPEILTDKYELSYKGISLPKSLTQIFTNINNMDTYPGEQESLSSQLKEDMSNNIAEEEHVQDVEPDCFDFGKIPDTVVNEAEFRGISPHCMETCIGCCTKVLERFAATLPSEGDQPEAEISNHGTENPVEMSASTSGGAEDPVVDEAEEKEDAVPSEETGENKNDGDTEKSKYDEKTAEEQRTIYRTVVKQVMKHIGRMFNPVISKAAKNELILLKRRYPSVFRDVCLYSNVCNLLSSSACRVTSRYFIQQLFNDVAYSTVYDDAARALREYIPAENTSMGDILPLISQSHSSSNKNDVPLRLYKPLRTKTVTASPIRVEKESPFDEVPVTYHTPQVKEAETQTCSADFLRSSSHI